MAYGNEVVLGFLSKDFEAVKAASGFWLPLLEQEEDWENDYDDRIWQTVNTKEVRQKLHRAHRRSLRAMKFKLIGYEDGGGNRPVAETPLGQRAFHEFEFHLHFDPHEMDEEPEQAVFGIALSGRYRPTCLDWRNRHGTLYPVTFDREMRLNIRRARKRLEAEFPWLSTADIHVIENHY